MDKLMKTSKKLDTFFKVSQRIIKIAMIVAVGVVAVLTVANFVNPDAVIAEGYYSIDVGSVTINLTEGYSTEDNNMVLSYVWIVMGLAAAAGVAVYYALGQVRKILQPMTEGNPFHPTVSTNIRKIAYVSIVLGVIANVVSFLQSFGAVAMIEKIKLLDYVKEGTIQSITANSQIDLTFLVVFFILLLVSYIFRYGEELQQQVDETL
ncbi:MAG: DUF2975 domain-containing protein [Lachnospiraceae bacterium]|nr:DUF2975 domain-containing protein [Lachnospiraceae bacterium]